MVQQKHTHKNQEQLITLANILQILREEDNVELLIESLFNYLLDNFDYRLIWLGLYDRIKHHLVGKKGFPEDNNDFFEQTFILDSGGLLEQVVIQQRPIGIPDLRQEERIQEWWDIAQKHQIQGTLLFPIRCKKCCFGVIVLGTHLWGISPHEEEKAHLAMVLGQLAATLSKLEIEWQFTHVKHPSKPLFSILEEIYQKPSLDLRLESVVMRTQKFIEPSFTKIYWYSNGERAFWHRVSIKAKQEEVNINTNPSSPKILVSDTPDFYQALSRGQLITIGSGRSLLKTKTTEKLLSQLKIRSLIAAPIIVDQNLLGFVTVEDTQARIWDKTDKNYLAAVAQIVTLSVGQRELDTFVQKEEENNQFLLKIQSIIKNESKTNRALKSISQLLKDYFNIDNLWILTEFSNSNIYDIFYNDDNSQEKPLLKIISKQEWEKYGFPDSIVTIENIKSDYKLKQWHNSLKALDVTSLIACYVPQKYLTGILVISHNNPYVWTNSEKNVIKNIAENISSLLGEEFLKQKFKSSSHHYQRIKKGFIDFWRIAFGSDNFEQVWLRYLALILESPVGVLITWDNPQKDNKDVDIQGKLKALVDSNSYLCLPQDLSVSINKDPLIKTILNGTRGCHLISRSTIPLKSRYWFLSENLEGNKNSDSNITTIQIENKSKNLEHFLTMALNSFGDNNIEGVIIFGDVTRHNWSSDRIELIELLIRQFASFNQFRKKDINNNEEIKKLQFLNWYKHICLEVMHQSVTSSMEAFGVLKKINLIVMK